VDRLPAVCTFRVGRHLPTAIVAVVLSLACLLALAPARASASVQTKHRSEYLQLLRDINSRNADKADALNEVKKTLIIIETDMKPLIGSDDPEDQAQLQGDEAWAAITMTTADTVAKEWDANVEAIEAFHATARRWFEQPADKAAFDRAATQYRLGTEAMVRQAGYIRDAAKALSNADLDGFSTASRLANKSRLYASKVIPPAKKKLFKLAAKLAG
jgi:hypothetical protein